MNDIKIVIDPGHGGGDPGVVYNGKQEKDFTLMISKFMYQRLKELGIPVYITRDDDISLLPNERISRILNAFGNNKNVVVISNHINSSQTPNSAEGAEVIYALRNNDKLSSKILEKIGEKGQIIRRVFQKRSEKDPEKDYYFIHRETGVTEPIIIEYGFINNDNDIKRVEENYKKYVNGVIEAIIETKNLKINNEEKYIVKEGDTLWSIAQKYNTNVELLKQANNLVSDLIMPNQVLKMPKKILNKIYVVKPGDSLWKIAQWYGVDVNELARINNIYGDFLAVGQIIKIPNVKKSNIVSYIIKPGDTLWTISQKYGVTVEEIKKLNGLVNNIIYIDQILQIPID